jgi:hypothetical protein
MNTPTYEEIDAAFASMDVARHKAGISSLTQQTMAATPPSVTGSICQDYKIVRPFLQAAANLPFLPPTWRTGISAFIEAMNLFCPQTGTGG